MKQTFILLSQLVLASFAGSVLAQSIEIPPPPPELGNTMTQNSPEPQLESPPAPQISLEVSSENKETNNSGNLYPLMKEVAYKNTILELKKIQKEIDNIDNEKKKEEKKEKQVDPAIVMKYESMLAAQNKKIQQLESQMVKEKEVAEIKKAEEVKVYSIFGLGSSLNAKIGLENQGGFVVTAGDILPDGRKVLSVKENYIEVLPLKGKKPTKFFAKSFADVKPQQPQARVIGQPSPQSPVPPIQLPMSMPASPSVGYGLSINTGAGL